MCAMRAKRFACSSSPGKTNNQTPAWCVGVKWHHMSCKRIILHGIAQTSTCVQIHYVGYITPLWIQMDTVCPSIMKRFSCRPARCKACSNWRLNFHVTDGCGKHSARTKKHQWLAFKDGTQKLGGGSDLLRYNAYRKASRFANEHFDAEYQRITIVAQTLIRGTEIRYLIACLAWD